MSYEFNRGLGVAPPGCAAGTTIFCAKDTDCSSGWQYALNPACWAPDSSGVVWTLGMWQQAAQMQAALPAPTPYAAPTPAALAAAAAVANDPNATDAQVQAAAAKVSQDISNAALAQTQANINASVQSLPDYTDTGVIWDYLPKPPNLFPAICGPNSVPWFTGMDNCTVLEIAGAVVGGIILLGIIGAAKGRR